MTSSNIDLKRLRDLVDRAEMSRYRRRQLKKQHDDARRAAITARREFEVSCRNLGLPDDWEDTDPSALNGSLSESPIKRVQARAERAEREANEALADYREAQRQGISIEALASTCAEYAYERLGSRCPLLVREFLEGVR